MTTVEELTSFLATPLTPEFVEWLRERQAEQPPGLAWHPRAFEFNPQQLRWPEGHRLGGRWAPNLGAIRAAENERGVRINKQTALAILETGLDQKRLPMGEAARRVLTKDGKLYKNTEEMYSTVERRHVYRPDPEKLAWTAPGGPEDVRVWDKKRRKLHERIVKRQLGHLSVGQGDQTALFMAGGSATGKSSSETVLKANGLWPDDAVTVDPDKIKESLPEYKMMAVARDPYSAMGAHEESSFLAKQLLEVATRKRRSVVIDGTGDSAPGKFLNKIRAQKKAGYRTRIVMTDADLSSAIDRAVARAAKTGRALSIPVIRELHREVARRHLEWRDSPDVDEWQLYSTETEQGAPPILVASGGGGSFSVHNETLYQATLGKANADLDAPLIATAERR